MAGVSDALPPLLFDAEVLAAAAVAVAALTFLLGRGLTDSFPRRTARMTALVVGSPGWTFLYGATILVASVVAMVLLLLTFVGFPFALLLATALLAGAAVGCALAFVALGEWLAPAAVSTERAPAFGAVAAGAVTLVPVVGGLTTVALAILGLGAVLAVATDR